MTGQDAVNVAETFNSELGVDGIVLTKLDGDTRGGAALSVRAVTHKPIKYIGVGEKLTDLEPFFPDRMASRILGMGDVLTLIEKAQSNFDEEKIKKLEKKLKNQEFDFDDFLDQLEQMKNMGPLNQILEMLPGVNNKSLKNLQVDDKELVHIQAIIQ
jgi:signal recognition particle subunit SRP54